MASRRKSRRLEELHEVQVDLRRSPRLRERYSRERSEGPPLITVAHTVTSRPGLSGYLRQKELENQTDSILNESGQSVPSYFDLGNDESRHLGFSEETGEPVHGYDTPDPQHLYGLDSSEDEDGGIEHAAIPEVPVTPRQSTGDDVRSGIIGWVVNGLMGILFRLGSILYLAATAILCLDVIILHRCCMVFTAMACWSSHAATKPWLRFWILPVVLFSLVAILIGGDLVPSTPNSTQYNITSADLSKLHSELTASIRSTLSIDVHHHVESHMNEVVKDWVESKLNSELQLTNSALEEIKSHFNLEISRLQRDMEILNARLIEMQNQTNSSYVTEAMVLEILQTQIQQHLKTAKQEWLKLVPQEMSAMIVDVDQLKADFSKADHHYSEKILLLEKLVESNNNTITAALLQLISELQTSSNSIAGLKNGVESHANLLAGLKAEVSQLTAIEEKERMAIVRRLEELEVTQLSRDDMAKVFDEEMKNSVESSSSVLWVWLSQELEKAKQDREEIPTSGLNKKDVNELIRVGLDRYSADRIAKFDFALENSGGVVVSTSDTYPPALQTYSVMGVPIWSVPSSPKTIIQPHVYPGDCWAMDGPSGYALIRLKQAVVVTGVTIEHIPNELTPSGSISSAPKKFRILGKNDTELVTEGDLLGQFSYAIDSTPIQEFTVKDEGAAYTHILFDFLSNHGNPLYTCVYRVRVHGHPVTPQT